VIRRLPLFLVSALMALPVLTLRAVQRDAQASVFRTALDVVQLDVTVLDRHRQPVTGLTAGEFTILEDGTPRRVETLLEVGGVADARRSSAAPSNGRSVAPAAAASVPERIVVVVIDDLSIYRAAGTDAFVIAKARSIVRTTIDSLGPHDLAAIVHANTTFTARDLTTDHAHLLSAATADWTSNGDCACGLCSPGTLASVSAALAGIPNLRKTVVFVSAGIAAPDPDPPPSSACFLAPFARAMQDVFSARS
jgi:VWFA-related protein